jgi:hypothetical protein
VSYEADLLAAAPSARRLFRPEAEISADMTTVEASASWWVDNADLTAALGVIGGTVETVSGFGSPITRVVPLRYPEYTWIVADNLRAVACGHDQKRVSTDGFYTGWKIHVHFRKPRYDIEGPDAFLSVSWQSTGRILPGPASAFVGAGSGLHPIHDPGLWVPGRDYTITLHQLPIANLDDYLAFWTGAQRSVNASTYRGIPAGQLMFNGDSGYRTTTIANVTTYEVSLSFSASNVPWNQEVMGDGSLEDLLMDGNPRYPAIDFLTLFP